MPFAQTRLHFELGSRLAILVTLTLLLLACASTRPTGQVNPVAAEATADDVATTVIRYGRYTLVETDPTTTQRDLMQQVIDVSIPAMMSETVGDALRYVLLKSGYRLCEDREAARELEALPLPAAHLHLGPSPLRQVLLLLAGSGWRLEVDETVRRVCFVRRDVAKTLETSHAGVAVGRDTDVPAIPVRTPSAEVPQ